MLKAAPLLKQRHRKASTTCKMQMQINSIVFVTGNVRTVWMKSRAYTLNCVCHRLLLCENVSGIECSSHHIQCNKTFPDCPIIVCLSISAFGRCFQDFCNFRSKQICLGIKYIIVNKVLSILWLFVLVSIFKSVRAMFSVKAFKDWKARSNS